MTRFMLDTNIVSQAVRNHPAVVARLTATPMRALCISAVTEAELLFGVERRPEAHRLRSIVAAFLARVDVAAWDRQAAASYGVLRAQLERAGRTLAPLDLLIAAHSLSRGSVLVTNDAAFACATELVREDWTAQAVDGVQP